MSEATLGPVRDGDLAEILRTFERFWGGDHPNADKLRHFHHPMFFREFAETAFVARTADGEIAGYLLGFVVPTARSHPSSPGSTC